jgi:hypothetical protein
LGEDVHPLLSYFDFFTTATRRARGEALVIWLFFGCLSTSWYLLKLSQRGDLAPLSRKRERELLNPFVLKVPVHLERRDMQKGRMIIRPLYYVSAVRSKQ